ncbi:MAG: hypothetical protein NC218_06065 [Acetobacter sp.]|nr:hypothetical protein [Acetobacter sp.]
MSKGIKAKKKMTALVICCSMIAMRPAAAFIWPSIDVSQVGSFVSKIGSGVNQVTTTKSQIDNATQTINSVGDSVTSITKYTADLKNTVAKIGEVNLQSVDMNGIKEKANEANKKADTLRDNNNEMADSTVRNVNLQLEEGASENEVQETLTAAKEEMLNPNEDLNNVYETTGQDIEDIINDVVEQLEKVVLAIEQNEDLTVEERKQYKEETVDLISQTESLKADAQEIIENAKNEYNTEYVKTVTEIFDAYSQSVSDYYANKITSSQLEQAGEEFRDKIASLPIGIDESNINKLIDKSQDILSAAQQLQENILNSQANSRDYSDEDEEPETEKISSIDSQVKYVFQYKSNHSRAYATGVYYNTNLEEEYQIFALPRELLCHKMNKDDISELEKHTNKFRECITLAKAEKEYVCLLKKGIDTTDSKCDPYRFEDKAIFEPHRRFGVYDHVIQDYSEANIVNNSRILQYVNTWQQKTLPKLFELISKGNIDNNRNAYVAMNTIDLEAPKLWSWIRVIDTLHRSKEAVQQFNIGSTLHLDERYAPFTRAYQDKNGLIKNIEIKNIQGKITDKVDRQVFSNVFLYNCGRNADNISVSFDDKYNAKAIETAEKEIAKCIYQYAAGASGSRKKNGDTYCDSGLTLQQCTTVWRDNEDAVINDSSFQTLTLATVNNYKSSRDYVTPKGDEVNITSLQKDMNKNTVARDDYASGAQTNYYSTMQILSIIDADAQNLQTEILKYLRDIDFNYFDEGFREES